MGRKGVDCGCGAREDLCDRIAALKQRIEVLETEINQVESEFPGVLSDVRDAKESAVAAAESASASAAAAEASAEIAGGFDERLGAVESGVVEVNEFAEEIDGDVTALKGRMGHAEDRIVDAFDYAEAIGDDVAAIDTEIHTTRPYMTTNTEQTISAKKHIPTAASADESDVAVNKAFVQATDGRNNLVHNIGDELIDGSKTYTKIQKMVSRSLFNQRVASVSGWYRVFALTVSSRSIIRMNVTEAHQSYNGGGAGEVILGLHSNPHCDWLTSSFHITDWSKGNVACAYNSTSSKWEIWYKTTVYFAYLDITAIFLGNIENSLAIENVYDGEAHAEIPGEYTIIKYGE